MDEVIYISTYAFNICVSTIAFAIARSTIKAGGEVEVCANRFAAIAVAIGAISGIPLLFSVLWLFERAGHQVNVGHGEGLIATPLFNFLLSVLVAIAGRILLRWKAIRW